MNFKRNQMEREKNQTQASTKRVRPKTQEELIAMKRDPPKKKKKISMGTKRLT